MFFLASYLMKAKNFASLLIVKPSVPLFQWAYLDLTAGIVYQPLEKTRLVLWMVMPQKPNVEKDCLLEENTVAWNRTHMSTLSFFLLRTQKTGLGTSCSKCMLTYRSKVNFQHQVGSDPVCRGMPWTVFFYLQTTGTMQ